MSGDLFTYHWEAIKLCYETCLVFFIKLNVIRFYVGFVFVSRVVLSTDDGLQDRDAHKGKDDECSVRQ